MGFNSGFKGLNLPRELKPYCLILHYRTVQANEWCCEEVGIILFTGLNEFAQQSHHYSEQFCINTPRPRESVTISSAVQRKSEPSKKSCCGPAVLNLSMHPI
jgi:hypothetical protein